MEGVNYRQYMAEMHRRLKSQKPDLKCPRCQSNDTTFGYFNNYKVTQPRYFCLNCAKYWTQGGKVRNTPNRPRTRKQVNPPSWLSAANSSAGGGAGGSIISPTPLAYYAPMPVNLGIGLNQNPRYVYPPMQALSANSSASMPVFVPSSGPLPVFVPSYDPRINFGGGQRVYNMVEEGSGEFVPPPFVAAAPPIQPRQTQNEEEEAGDDRV